MANIHDVNESLQVQPSVRNLPTLIALSQGENGRSLQFRMVGATIPSGSSASLSGTKPDGVVYSKAGTVDGNTVIFQEDVQLTAVAGAWDAKIHIVNSGNSVATALIRFIIDPDPVAAGAVPSDSQLEGIVAECRMYAENAKSAAYGSPLTASAAADMIDTSKVYVYTGSETGYTAGHWYYYNGTAWADGGVYNSIAIQTDTTLTLPDHAADAKATGDALATKADKIGNIAIAKSLYGGEYASESEPYHFRQTPDGMGSKNETIVGGSLGWNQLLTVASSDKSKTQNGIIITDNRDGTYTVSTESGGATDNTYLSMAAISVINGHRYLFSCTPRGGSTDTYYSYCTGNVSGLRDYGEGTIYSANASGATNPVVIYVKTGTVISNTITFKSTFIDLTQMFGTTIADYIYSLEQATAGAGVAFVKRYIDLDTYHEYDAGSIQSVEGLVSHDVVGVNQAEPLAMIASSTDIRLPANFSTDTVVKLFNGFTYSSDTHNRGITLFMGKFSAGDVITFSANSNVNLYRFGYTNTIPSGTASVTQTMVISPNNNVGAWTFTCPSDGYYWANFWNSSQAYPWIIQDIQCEHGSVATQYEPYEKRSYPLDSSVTLRGVPKLVTDHIEFDGDRYYADGSVERRYGERAYQSGDESLANAITDGTTTVYKLTTATTETAQPFQSPQLVGATEEYVTTGVVPVGHESRYYEDITGKVNNLPSDFSTLIAPVEKSFTTTRNYTVGSYLIVKNQLYKVTSAISSGGTITPNSNVTATTIMAEILALA